MKAQAPHIGPAPLPWHRQPLFRSIAMAIAALLLYGTWAWFANSSHGSAAAWKAFATQGFVSFSVTFFITAVMEALSRIGANCVLQFIYAAGGAIVLTVTYTVGMHWFMGTPEIFNTAAPVLTLGSIYCLLYTGNLVRESIQDRAEEKN